MSLIRPPALRTDASSRFAHHTMRVRVPAMLRALSEKNPDYAPGMHLALEQLHDEILGDRAPEGLSLPTLDASAWSRALAERDGEGWLSTDWFFAEAYLYRRVLQAVRYWETGRDPFGAHKREEMAGDGPWEALGAALEASEGKGLLAARARAALWGNRIDLNHAVSAARGGAGQDADLLVDQCEEAMEMLRARPGEVHVLVDNAGTELLLDLALVDALLAGPASRVLLHVKMTPTFVSDAIAADVRGAIVALEAGARPAAVQALGARLREAFQQGRLGVHPGLYWNSHRFFFDMPPLLNECLSGAALVIVKGDANYRRLTGDARWPTDTSFARVTAFFPAPLLALRTLKSDSVVGLAPGQGEALDAEDPEWRTNGQRGVASWAMGKRGG